jgi:hypothetical protein
VSLGVRHYRYNAHPKYLKVRYWAHIIHHLIFHGRRFLCWYRLVVVASVLPTYAEGGWWYSTNTSELAVS